MKLRWLGTILLCAACGSGEAQPNLDVGALPAQAEDAARPERGGTFAWGRSGDASHLDPAVVTDGESVQVVTNLFDTLVTFKKGEAEIVPWLAERWEVSEDGLVWTFTLREGVRFHDGTPLDAEAVVFSFERQRDEDHPAHVGSFAYYQDNFGMLEKVEALDARTVRFTLSYPHAPFLDALALFSSSIVSPAAWQSEGVGEDGKYRYPFARKPVGSGPFVFVEWKRDERIVLRANDEHFAGRPPIDELVFRPIKEPLPRLKSLESGEIQGMDNPDFAALARAQENPELRVLSRPGLNVSYLAMHTQKPPFDDVRVRRAVALAIDKRRLIEAAYQGYGDPAPSVLPRRVWGFLDAGDRGPDLERARALLAEAGHAGGFATELWYGDAQRTYLPNPDGLAIQIQQDLKEIGIRAELKKMEWSAYIPATRRGDHPMCLLGWMADVGDPDNFLFVLLDKTNARPGSANNVSFYTGERYSELVTKARRIVDRAERTALYEEAQRILAEDVPLVPLVTAPDFRILRADVRGYAIYPVGGEYFREVSFAK